jgi:FkbM family methyltransferase
MNNKILKKIVGIFGYKIIEKNFIKNQNNLFTKSNFTVEKILDLFFQKNYISALVQIGANDGISYENINYFIKKYRTKSLLVEPIKNNFQQLIKNYDNLNYVNLENSAVSLENEIIHLYKVDEKYLAKYPLHAKAIPSFDYKHLIKHGIKKKHITKENVNQITFLDLFKKYKINNFDLLYIDTEGYDCNLVNNFLENIKIRPIIIFEWIHASNAIFSTCLNMLTNHNYFLLPVQHDLICIPKEKNINILLN